MATSNKLVTANGRPSNELRQNGAIPNKKVGKFFLNYLFSNSKVKLKVEKEILNSDSTVKENLGNILEKHKSKRTKQRNVNVCL